MKRLWLLLLLTVASAFGADTSGPAANSSTPASYHSLGNA
jgi:hypothetical protein